MDEFGFGSDSRKVEEDGKRIEKLAVLKGYDGPDRIIDWHDYLLDHEVNKDLSVSFRSGMTELDSLVEGFHTEELVTISGNTSQGKTLFLKSLVKLFSEQGVPVTVFSFEDPTYRFLEPFKGLENCKTLYVPNELISGSLQWLEDRATESKLKFDSKIIVIDHLHYIVDMALQHNFSLNIGASMRFIKEKIAIGLKQLVFIVCHQEKNSNDVEASLNTIRDSSFIGQESDMVFIVNRVPDETYHIEQDGIKTKKVKIPQSEWSFDKGYATVKIEKARRSGVHRKKIHVQKRGSFLEELCLPNN